MIKALLVLIPNLVALAMILVLYLINKNDKDEKSYKFGVLGTGGWLEDIQDAIEDFKNQ